MRLRPERRGLAWALVALLLLNACATVPTGTGGSGRPVLRGAQPGSEEWEDLKEARRAEVESALAGMWGVAAGVREVGAVLEFTFWAEGGALTLVALGRHEWGGEAGSGVDKAAFARELRENLLTYVERHTGSVRLTLRREQGRWRVDYETEEGEEAPAEAKTWPVRRVGVRAEVLEGLLAAGNEAASRLWVPEGARVRWQVEIALEDERVKGLETQPPRQWAGGRSVKAAPELAGTLVNVLVPFSQGLGPRRVRVELEGTNTAGARVAHWRVVEAEVIRPPPPAPEQAQEVAEYRAMHEQIQRQWREETREGFQQMGGYTLEHLALWVVGGLAARGVGVVVEAVAPTIARALAQGGARAAGWFRSLLVRAPTAEKQALNRLMVKAETQGLESLTIVEREQLNSLLARLERLASTPLQEIPGAKGRLRDDANAYFYEKLYPGLSKILRDSKGSLYDVHHCIPLEYAHLFPLRDINAISNLAAAARPVHVKINSVWGFLKKARGEPTVAEVEEVDRLVRKHFGRWFNKVYDGSESAAKELAAAESAAMGELSVLLRRWQ
ncbi:MAG TPA: hypothetical protein VK539_29675 [Myxococcaceae bacterium]|nr:hypothetical protein [Myxococcaceae bacterium]